MNHTELVEKYFFNTEHVGELPLNDNSTVHTRVGSKEQAEYFELYVKLSPPGAPSAIKQACFKASGSPYLIAALEWLCREIESRGREVLKHFQPQELQRLFKISARNYPTALLIDKGCKQLLQSLEKMCVILYRCKIDAKIKGRDDE